MSLCEWNEISVKSDQDNFLRTYSLNTQLKSVIALKIMTNESKGRAK